VDFYMDPDMANRYQVPGHPTLVLTRPDGESAWVRPGVATREEIVEAFEEVLR
jgi:hypothetical protein